MTNFSATPNRPVSAERPLSAEDARARVAELIQRSRELAPLAIAHAQACRELQQRLMDADWAWTADGDMTADWESVNTDAMLAGLMAIAEPCGKVAEVAEADAAWLHGHGFPTLD